MDNVYSYHTFILPVVWKDDTNTSKSFDTFTEIFEKNPYWTCLDPQDENSFSKIDDEFSYYNEYQYFYPQIRSALYGFGENIVKTYHFAYNEVHNKAHYYIEKNARTYDLLINSIHLKIYNTGIALFVMECENHGTDKSGNPQNTLADVKSINDYGRRITLPFIPAKPEYSVCADSLEVYIPGLDRNFKTDFRAFIKEINSSDKKAHRINLNHLCSYIKEILGFNCEFLFSSKVNNEKEIVYVHPAMDDRMFVSCIVIDKEETKNMLGDPETNKEYPYEADVDKEKSLYEFIFLDTEESCTCRNKQMREDLLDKHVYKRWLDYGSLYGVCAQSMVLLFNGDAMHLVGSFLTIYVRMACLCLAQRASLMLFQKETADISRLIHERENKISIATVTKLMDLQERFSAFESQICFSEITPQEQGIELYSMFTQSFLIDKELENVKSQITGLHDATDTYLDFNFNIIALIFTVVSAFIGLTSMIEYNPDTKWWVLPLITLVTGGFICMIIMIAFRRRRRRRKK